MYISSESSRHHQSPADATLLQDSNISPRSSSVKVRSSWPTISILEFVLAISCTVSHVPSALALSNTNILSLQPSAASNVSPMMSFSSRTQQMLNIFMEPPWSGAEGLDFVPPNIPAVAVSRNWPLPRHSQATRVLTRGYDPSS